MAKILFVRHGESEDDLTDQYGGWLDLSLTEEGRRQTKSAVDEIKLLDISFTRIIHSPLARASETAELLAEGLNLPFEESVWLKERNGYGLLTGLNRDEAKKKYQDLVKDLQSGYVVGMERDEDFKDRIIKAFEIISDMNEDIIVVSHGGFTSELFKTIINKQIDTIGDLGYILLEVDKLEVVTSGRAEFMK